MIFGDFALLPPEIISAQIHSGSGAGSLLAAAESWDGLAAELHSTAASYESAISGLTNDSWAGPSSESMAAAAAPYVTWLSTTAGQAEEAAAGARVAAGAYEAVLAATVPPALVAANRSELQSLLASNVLGQNGGAIAANEAEYGQMWAQDVDAMFGYASASSDAGDLSSFTDPPKTTNDDAQAAQSAATTSSSTASSSSSTSWLTQIENYITSLTTQYTDSWENLITGATGNSQIAPLWETLYSSISGIGSQGTWTNVVNSSSSLGISQWKNFFIYRPWSAGIAKSGLGAGLSSPGHIAPHVASASLGNAPTVGRLSVPASWATATPAMRLAATALPATSAAASATGVFPGNLVNEATLGSLSGGALGSPASRAVRSTEIQRRAVTGERRQEPVKLDRVIAQLQEMPDQVQHWNVDESGLDELVARLRTTPGVHAVHVNEGKETAAARSE
ncbi:PPE family protein [Mycobacterium sp. Aquia_216]|uniref:PPE family protein n=1 Tax=Mycobacterium sp. Aquia_216 TaxID=2991729 RepID=UPI00227B6012|nr:PPE family protein [Mycobacterium sp. Aquia_216]WAJ46306.1 PPE family protein [Mycobacterium sp. Aquia_216]